MNDTELMRRAIALSIESVKMVVAPLVPLLLAMARLWPKPQTA